MLFFQLIPSPSWPLKTLTLHFVAYFLSYLLLCSCGLYNYLCTLYFSFCFLSNFSIFFFRQCVRRVSSQRILLVRRVLHVFYTLRFLMQVIVMHCFIDIKNVCMFCSRRNFSVCKRQFHQRKYFRYLGCISMKNIKHIL